MSRTDGLLNNLKEIVGGTSNDKLVTAGDDQSDEDTPKKETTAVTGWLKKNDAQDYIDEFYNQGYYKMEGVDDKAIDAIVKDKPGIANTLKNSLAEHKKYASSEPMAPPALPPGTRLDLSAPNLRTPDGINFSIDKSLSVKSTDAAIKSPNNIKPEEWIVIARGANLLYAYDMDSDEPRYAKTPILDWIVPDRDDFVRSEISHARVTTELTYSDETASYVTSGFDTQTATAGYTYCAASFERNHKHKTAISSTEKKLIQVGMWKYPRAQIYLDKCTVTSDRYVDAIRKALEADDSFGELNKVFKEYGHVIPSSVLLGGQLCYQQEKTITSEMNEEEEEMEIKAAVKAKVSMVSASAGGAFGSGSDTGEERKKLGEFTSFTNQGGDSLLCTNPPEWAPTVKDPANWAVIEMDGMRPTIDLLDEEIRQRVLDVWNNSEAILNPKEIDDWREGEGVLYPGSHRIRPAMDQSSGFAVGMRHCMAGARGSLQLISSGFRGDPKLGDQYTAAGAAFAHKYGEGDNWIECSSICLPVPQGGSFKTKFDKTSGDPGARLMFVPSNLRFGNWQKCKAEGGEKIETWQSLSIAEGDLKVPNNQDGFLFVNIEGKDLGDGAVYGGVMGRINGQEIAGSYVRQYAKDDERIQQQNFCIPVPGDASVEVWIELGIKSPKYPDVNFYWIPLEDTHWKMLEAKQITLNTQILAETDGVLHGWIRDKNNGDRGTLKLYTGEDAFETKPELLPSAGASMYYVFRSGTPRLVRYSSLMLPVARGTTYKAVFTQSSGIPQAQVYWTAIVHR